MADSVNVRPNEELLRKLAGQLIGQLRDAGREPVLLLTHDEIDAWRCQFDGTPIPIGQLAFCGVPIREMSNGMIVDLPAAFQARIDEWCEANEQDPKYLQHGVFPLGMVQRWIERAQDAEAEVKRKREAVPEEIELLNQIHQVYFRAGLLAARESLARFVECESPTIANSIRLNWWPSLGPDLGPPRQLEWGELTEGEYGQPGFRCKDKDEVSPTLEALPLALAFLQQRV